MLLDTQIYRFDLYSDKGVVSPRGCGIAMRTEKLVALYLGIDVQYLKTNLQSLEFLSADHSPPSSKSNIIFTVFVRSLPPIESIHQGDHTPHSLGWTHSGVSRWPWLPHVIWALLIVSELSYQGRWADVEIQKRHPTPFFENKPKLFYSDLTALKQVVPAILFFCLDLLHL
jgi:hypothetical protein